MQMDYFPEEHDLWLFDPDPMAALLKSPGRYDSAADVSSTVGTSDGTLDSPDSGAAASSCQLASVHALCTTVGRSNALSTLHAAFVDPKRFVFDKRTYGDKKPLAPAIQRLFGPSLASSRAEDLVEARNTILLYADFGSPKHLSAVVPQIVASLSQPTFDAMAYIGAGPEASCLKRKRNGDVVKCARLSRKDRQENVSGQRWLGNAASYALEAVLSCVQTYNVDTKQVSWCKDAEQRLGREMLACVFFLTAVGASSVLATHWFLRADVQLCGTSLDLLSSLNGDIWRGDNGAVALVDACLIAKPIVQAVTVALFARLFPAFVDLYAEHEHLCLYIATMTFRCFACRKHIPFVQVPGNEDEFVHERIVSRCDCDVVVFCSHACINNTLLNDRAKQERITLACEGRPIDGQSLRYFATNADGQSRGRHSLCPTCVHAYPYGFGMQTLRVGPNHRYCLTHPCAECRAVVPLPLAPGLKLKAMPLLERITRMREYFDAHAPNAHWDANEPKPVLSQVLLQCASDGLQCRATRASDSSATGRSRCDISGTFVTHPLWCLDRCQCFVAMRSVLKPLLATLDGACPFCGLYGNRAVKVIN